MTNHLHLIIQQKEGKLSGLVRVYRAEMAKSRLKYIHENPLRAGWVESPEDYLYSSARNYSGLPGLIEIDYS